jgi:hypothetical protein
MQFVPRKAHEEAAMKKATTAIVLVAFACAAMFAGCNDSRMASREEAR